MERPLEDRDAGLAMSPGRDIDLYPCNVGRSLRSEGRRMIAQPLCINIMQSHRAAVGAQLALQGRVCRGGPVPVGGKWGLHER